MEFEEQVKGYLRYRHKVYLNMAATSCAYIKYIQKRGETEESVRARGKASVSS